MEFDLYVAWKSIIVSIIINPLPLVIIFFIYGKWYQIVLVMLAYSAFMLVPMFNLKYRKKYYMDNERLYWANGEFARYEDITKIIQFEKKLLFGVDKQTRIKIEGNKGVAIIDFIPLDVDSFVSHLRENCPNAEYIISK